MRPLGWILSSWLAIFAFWSTFAACVIDQPLAPDPPAARLIASWEPTACGDPHRVVLELEDEAGTTITASAPCFVGGIAIDVTQLGLYRGRIYAWVLDAPIRSIRQVSIAIDAPVIRWQLEAPP